MNYDRGGNSCATATLVVLSTYAQPLRHAADQLRETAVLLARLLLAAALQQLGRPLLELMDPDLPARGVIRPLTFGEVAV